MTSYDPPFALLYLLFRLGINKTLLDDRPLESIINRDAELYDSKA